MPALNSADASIYMLLSLRHQAQILCIILMQIAEHITLKVRREGFHNYSLIYLECLKPPINKMLSERNEKLLNSVILLPVQLGHRNHNKNNISILDNMFETGTESQTYVIPCSLAQ